MSQQTPTKLLKGHVKIDSGKTQSVDDDYSDSSPIPQEHDHKKENKKFKIKHLMSCHDLPHLKHSECDNSNL